MPNWRKIITSGSDASLNSLVVTNGITGSLLGTASFASSVPASGIIGNVSQIATGSVTASVSPSQFTVVSGSVTELVVTGTGVTIGNAITDTHRVSGSLLLTGSATITGTTQTTQLGIGAAPSGSTRLDVRAQGALSSDIAFRVRNSADTQNSFQIDGLGQGRIKSTGFTPSFSVGYDWFGSDRNAFVFTQNIQNFRGQEWTFNAGYNGNIEGLQITNDLTGNDQGQFTIQSNNYCFGTSISVGEGAIAERRVMRLVNGVAPSTNVTDGFKFYSSTGSISGNSRPHFRTSNGTVVWLGDESRLFNITGSRLILSASSNMNSGSTLTVYGSGSAQPVFTVQGSQGELFSITDSLSGSLFSVNDVSGLPIMEVFSDSTTLIGNYLDPMLITTAKVTQTNSGSFTVYSLPTASYDTAFFEYSIKSGSNARAGTIMAIQSGTSVNFTETTTTDFGNTSAVSFTVIVTGSNMALTGSSTSGAWTIKSIIRGL